MYCDIKITPSALGIGVLAWPLYLYIRFVVCSEDVCGVLSSVFYLLLFSVFVLLIRVRVWVPQPFHQRSLQHFSKGEREKKRYRDKSFMVDISMVAISRTSISIVFNLYVYLICILGFSLILLLLLLLLSLLQLPGLLQHGLKIHLSLPLIQLLQLLQVLQNFHLHLRVPCAVLQNLMGGIKSTLLIIRDTFLIKSILDQS